MTLNLPSFVTWPYSFTAPKEPVFEFEYMDVDMSRSRVDPPGGGVGRF